MSETLPAEKRVFPESPLDLPLSDWLFESRRKDQRGLEDTLKEQMYQEAMLFDATKARLEKCEVIKVSLSRAEALILTRLWLRMAQGIRVCSQSVFESLVVMMGQSRADEFADAGLFTREEIEQLRDQFGLNGPKRARKAKPKPPTVDFDPSDLAETLEYDALVMIPTDWPFEFETYRSLGIKAIDSHPGLGPDSTCPTTTDPSEWDWMEKYSSGKTILDLYEDANKTFEMWGW